MQTATLSPALIRHLRVLLFGSMLAAGLWLTGYAELAWLGFAAAAMGADPGGRRAPACLSRRSTS
jgi:hypothetical protein